MVSDLRQAVALSGYSPLCGPCGLGQADDLRAIGILKTAPWQGHPLWPAFSGALGEIRTHTGRVLNPFPLPVGIRGLVASVRPPTLNGRPPEFLSAGVHDTMCVMTGPTTDADAATPRRVLIAEDEALIRMDLAEMLREEGYEIVGEAGDGQEAVELAELHKPDLVIMDVKMPRRDGIDAASEIASKRIAPIVILTAFSQRDLVERARDAGAMAYLVKPFTASDLIPAIELAVSRFSEVTALEQRSGDAFRPVGDPQAGRTRQGPTADQAGHDRAGSVQVDSARCHGPAHHR